MTPSLDILTHPLPWVDSTKLIRPTSIVLHWWGEPISVRGIVHLSELLEKRQLSVQFAVLANGDIYQLTDTADVFCRHAKCANESAIGIEIEGNDERDLDANIDQFHSVARLVKYLQNMYSISSDFHVEQHPGDIRFYGVTSHKQVDTYCADANGKVDVHDEYVRRIIEEVKSCN